MSENRYICPNCGMKMNKKEYCFHCGYMENGNFISPKKINVSLIELYLGTDYNKIYRNKNWFIAGLLGPIYILAHNFYIEGLLLIILDMFFSIFFMVFNHAYISYYIVVFLNIIYVICNRYVWSGINNLIYLKLLSIRLELYKKLHPKDYKMKIQSLYRTNKYILAVKYIVLGIIYIIVFFYIRSIIYNSLGLI